MEQDKDMTAERITEYGEELEIIQEGIEVYETKLGQAGEGRADKKYECRKELFDLKMKHKRVTASMLQLEAYMDQSEKQMKFDMDHMNTNWHTILTKAMGMKNKFRSDNKRIVEGIKKTDTEISWETPEHKLIAYKTLRNIINNNSNGK